MKKPMSLGAPGGSFAAALALAMVLVAAPADAQPLADSAAVAETSAPARSISDPIAGTVAPVDSTPSPTARGVAARPDARMIVGSRRVRLTGKDNVVRSGPGNRFSIVGVFPKDVAFPVIARSGEWFGARLSDTETGWVHRSLCLELDDLTGLEFKPNPKLYSRTGSYVLSGYAGAYAFDRKSNSLALGGRLGYYLFDRLQAEAGVSWTHVQRPQEIVESLFGLSLEAEDFHMLFYQLDLVWELLPGRQMVPFVCGGAGSAIMLGRSEASFNFGAGTKLFLSRRCAMRWEVRDYRFKSGSDAARLSNDNIEFTLGTEILF